MRGSLCCPLVVFQESIEHQCLANQGQETFSYIDEFPMLEISCITFFLVRDAALPLAVHSRNCFFLVSAWSCDSWMCTETYSEE